MDGGGGGGGGGGAGAVAALLASETLPPGPAVAAADGLTAAGVLTMTGALADDRSGGARGGCGCAGASAAPPLPCDELAPLEPRQLSEWGVPAR